MASERFKFFADYEATSREVQGASHQFFRSALQTWFSCLDESSVVQRLIDPLNQDINIDEWVKRYIDGYNFSWPGTRKDRLSAQLTLFRLFSQGKADAAEFGFRYIPSSDSNINRAVQRVVDQIYRPLVAELRRYVDNDWSSAPDSIIPASDRIVSLDHNSEAYGGAIASLEKVEKVLKESNEIAPEEKEQRLAEIQATHTLLKPSWVNVKTVMTVAGFGLLWLVQHFAEKLLGQAADAAWTALKLLFGL